MASSSELLLREMKETFSTFKCSIQDLRNPSEDFVTNFYSFLLSELEADLKNVNNVQPEQWGVLEQYSDAFTTIIPKGNLLRCIRALGVVPDFGMLDIVSPTPNRIQHILRAFTDFYRHSDDKFCRLIDKHKELKERKEKMAQKFKEMENNRKCLNDAIIKNGSVQEEEKKLEEEIAQREQKLPELKLQKQAVKTDVDEANEKLKEKERDLHKVNKDIANVSNKLKECTSLIVDSPSSLLVDMDSLRERNTELGEMSDQKRDMLEEKMQTQLKRQTHLTEQQQRLEELIDFITLLQQHKDISRILNELERNTKVCQGKLTEMKSSLLTITNKKQVSQETLQEVYLQWKTMKPSLIQNVEDALRELNKQKDAKNKMTNYLKEDAEIQAEIDLNIKTFKTKFAQFKINSDIMVGKLHEYFSAYEAQQAKSSEQFTKELDRYMKKE